MSTFDDANTQVKEKHETEVKEKKRRNRSSTRIEPTKRIESRNPRTILGK